MRIQAKFGSVCPGCGKRIRVGDEVEWTRGKPARHPGCRAKAREQEVEAPGNGGGPWAVLWLREGAPKEVVKAAYRALVKLHHPDAGGDVREMQRVNAAYQEIEREVGHAG